ncbi:MAG: hypothetical protein LQ350_005967 [Teloschistes chrysophthalmus]|nr:MAG: hypothetical protein LQ350_005967 [Niorma chrysophthalma]
MSPKQSTKATGTAQAHASTDEISYHGAYYHKTTEGLAHILNPLAKDSHGGKKQQSVFYNPIQQFNRDLSVLAIRIFAEDLAKIRGARNERRLQGIANEGQKGKKRKRKEEAHPAREQRTNGIERVKGSETLHGGAEQLSSPIIEGGDQQPDQGKALSNGLGAIDTVKSCNEGFIAGYADGTNCHVSENQSEQSTAALGADPQIPTGPKQKGTYSDSADPFEILDALSATGLRALRYVKEIPLVTSVTANDLSLTATESIRLNVQYNGVADKINATTSDAKAIMYKTATRAKDLYEAIDLDPYGTAVPFLDAALQAVTDGGLLCVTCTDSGVFASVGWAEKTFSQYGGLPWKGPQNHEAGLRLVLNTIASSAARYGLAVEPLLSLNIDFYVRLFVRVRRSAAEVKFLAGKTMVVYNCDQGCGSYSIQYLAQSKEKEAKNGDRFYTHSLAQAPSANPFCEHCGFKTHLVGPMWGGPLHNPHFVAKILDLLPSLDRNVYGTIPRIEGMLTLALNETLFQDPIETTIPESQPFPPLNPALRDPHPFFVSPASLGRTLHTAVPSDAALRGALIGLGYRTTRSHTEPGSIRTDAPWHVVWEIMREWARQKSSIKEGTIKKGMAGWEIMRKDRSRRGLEAAKQELRDAIEKAEDVKVLGEDVQAALHRLAGKLADGVDGHAQGGGFPEEGVDGQPSGINVVFDEKVGKEAAGKKMVRYQMNPRPDWGPMSKAKGGP